MVRRGGQRGFTLIELMLATGILMLGLTGIVAFQINAARSGQQAADLVTATQLTHDLLDSYRVKPRSTMVVPSSTSFGYTQAGAPAGGPTGYFTSQVQLAATTTPAGALDVYVSTTWKPPGLLTAPLTVTMESWIPLL